MLCKSCQEIRCEKCQKVIEPEPKDTFTVTVDYDDPAYRELKKEDYWYLNSELTIAHFPVRGEGKKNVVMEYITFANEATTQEVLDEIEKRGLRRPDFAETWAFHKAFPDEHKVNPVISLCGELSGDDVAYVLASGGGFRVGFSHRQRRWDRHYRFFGIRK